MSFHIQKSQQHLEMTESQDQNVEERTIKRKVIILSIFYFLVTVSMASFSTVIIYIHQKYKHKGYGESYLTANSLSSTVTYFFCPLITQKAKNSKLLLLLCTLGYFINLIIPTILSAIQSGTQSHEKMVPPSLTSFTLEILANVVGGMASSLFWVLQGIYITKYCINVPANQKGKYFSLANVILNSRIAIGPLLTMIGLGLGNETIYFALLSVIILSSFPIVFLYIPSINLADQQAKPLSRTEQNQMSQSTGSTEAFSILRYILSFFAYFKQIRLLVPASILSGLIVGFVSSSLSHLLPPSPPGQNNDTKVGIALFFFGVGNILGGHLSGVICDKSSIKAGGYLGCLLVILGSIVEAICLSLQHTVGRSSFVGFMSGLSYSYVLSFVVIVCTIHYKGTALSFATNKQVTSFSYISYQWAVAFLNNKCNMELNMTYQGLALIPLALIAACCIKRQYEWHENAKVGENASGSDLDMGKTIENKEGEKQKYKQNFNGQQG